MPSAPSRPLAGPAIELSDVAVRYRVPTERILSFKEYVLRRIGRPMEFRELWALRGVTLTVRPGEVLGVVGRNGAGKSTLLKVVSRVLHPVAGRVIVRGRLAPLLGLGAGFHPDLTGRENVLLNGTLLGYSKAELARSLEEVTGFAELEDFIDAPLRTYSSGMMARLGFAVATQFRPDVLIIDEVLAVGDAGFRERCLERIQAYRSAGTAILLVSHSKAVVENHCDQVVWLEKGQIAALGPPPTVLPRYADAMARS